MQLPPQPVTTEEKDPMMLETYTSGIRNYLTRLQDVLTKVDVARLPPLPR